MWLFDVLYRFPGFWAKFRATICYLHKAFQHSLELMVSCMVCFQRHCVTVLKQMLCTYARSVIFPKPICTKTIQLYMKHNFKNVLNSTQHDT